jgi:acetyltransferase-like isoleucine patch superfamily enzyme
MIGQYDFPGTLRMIRNLILTKLLFPQARIIRFPFDIRNKKSIRIGNNFTCGVGCRLEAHPGFQSKNNILLSIGSNVQINDYVHISAGQNVFIGDNVLIASKVFISDHNHGSYSGSGYQDSPDSIPQNRALHFSDVIIEDNVWIGEFVSILPGVRIGRGSIIGTMTVVTKNVPPDSIAVGSPAKVIKKFDYDTKAWKAIP